MGLYVYSWPMSLAIIKRIYIALSYYYNQTGCRNPTHCYISVWCVFVFCCIFVFCHLIKMNIQRASFDFHLYDTVHNVKECIMALICCFPNSTPHHHHSPSTFTITITITIMQDCFKSLNLQWSTVRTFPLGLFCSYCQESQMSTCQDNTLLTTCQHTNLLVDKS